MSVVINAAVEGPTDEAIAMRLICHVGAKAGTVYGKKGKSHLRDNVRGYNSAARHAPWLVLVDLDHNPECAPPLKTAWLPNPPPRLCFRIAVRAVESWLLADCVAVKNLDG